MVALLFSLFALSQLVASGSVVQRATPAAGCDSNTKALATGLQNNIAVQNQELSIAKEMSKTLAANPVDTNAFQEQKTKLLSTVKQGMEIREKNQKIPNSNQAVTQGLNKVANAQKQELQSTEGLKASDVAQSATTVKSLQAAFEGGIKENSNTLKQVLSQCPKGQSNNGKNGDSQPGSSNSTNSTKSNAGSSTGTSGKKNQKSPTPTGSSTKNQDSSSRKGSSKDQNQN